MTCNHRWKEIYDNTDITGAHLHVYECELCGLSSHGIETALSKKLRRRR